MPKQTLGQYLLNASLPKGYAFKGPVTSKELNRVLSELARNDPEAYVKSVTQIKRLGDEFSTVEGISVGLDDIEPDRKTRDAILKPAMEKIKAITDPEKRVSLIHETQTKLRDSVSSHPGSLTDMAKSGGRGNLTQLMKTVSSPVAVTSMHGDTVPWLIGRSYSEGLKPSEAWVAGDEARRNVIEGKTEVTEPGEVGKLLTQALLDSVVISPDCGTHNGILTDVNDKRDLLDRFLAKPAGKFPHNTLLTSDVVDAVAKSGEKHVVVRSPMTCDIHTGGVCAKCMGLNEKGQQHTIGTNVGVRAAQAQSEPLTQFTLSAKHGTRLSTGAVTTEPGGIEAVRDLLEIPKSFSMAATVATHDGKVDSIEKAPQGGHYVHVAGEEHYVPPDLQVTVKRGETVEGGDALSSGIVPPNVMMEYKGLGAGRKYLVDRLQRVYNNAGVDLDRRHLELLAKAHLSHVEIEDDPKDEFIRGDVVHFSKLRPRLEDGARSVALDKADGKVLAEDYLQFSTGTTVKPSMIKALKPHFDSVKVAVDPPSFRFYMPPLKQLPLLREDFLARLSHSHLKQSLLEGAQQGQTSNLHGTHPTPGVITGTITEGEDGTY